MRPEQLNTIVKLVEGGAKHYGDAMDHHKDLASDTRNRLLLESIAASLLALATMELARMQAEQRP